MKQLKLRRVFSSPMIFELLNEQSLTFARFQLKEENSLPYFLFFCVLAAANVGKNCIFCMLLQETLCGDTAMKNVCHLCHWMYIGVFFVSLGFFFPSYWPWTQTRSVREKKRSIVYLIAHNYTRKKSLNKKKKMFYFKKRWFLKKSYLRKTDFSEVWFDVIRIVHHSGPAVWLWKIILDCFASVFVDGCYDGCLSANNKSWPVQSV